MATSPGFRDVSDDPKNRVVRLATEKLAEGNPSVTSPDRAVTVADLTPELISAILDKVGSVSALAEAEDAYDDEPTG